MKISNDVIQAFRLICRNEIDTPAKDVKFKLTRNFDLGEVVKAFDTDTYLKQFGDFCMLYCKGKIINIYHDKNSKHIKVNNDLKYRYNVEMGRPDLNKKYNK